MKRLLSITLALIMVLGAVFAFPASASSKKTYKKFEYFVKGNAAYIVSYSGKKTGEVKIPEKINGKKVVEVLYLELVANNKTTKITIPRYVKKVGNSDFYFKAKFSVDAKNKYLCSVNGMLISKNKKTLYIVPSESDNDIVVPNTVTKIMPYAFSACKGGYDMKVHLPKSLRIICNYAFLNAGKMSRLRIPSGVKVIGTCAFYDAFDVDIKNYKPGDKRGVIVVPKSVELIGRMAFGFMSGMENDDGCLGKSFLVKAPRFSEAEMFAKANGLAFKSNV